MRLPSLEVRGAGCAWVMAQALLCSTTTRSVHRESPTFSRRHRNTAARHRGRGLRPSDRAEPRAYRTRPDPFQEEWASLEVMLRDAPALQAKTLFADLRARKPGVFRDGHLRTLQRRVKLWRATHGPEKVPFFPQEHRPGEAAQTDFTWAIELAITIHGEPIARNPCNRV